VVSFAREFTTGGGGGPIRGAWLDVMNRNFVRRLQHHATTALEQGIFLIDTEGKIRHRTVVGSIDRVPDGQGLAALTRPCCADGRPAT
jgi:hypothetical protein